MKNKRLFSESRTIWVDIFGKKTFVKKTCPKVIMSHSDREHSEKQCQAIEYHTEY